MYQSRLLELQDTPTASLQRGKTPYEYPRYDIKPSEDEALA